MKTIGLIGGMSWESTVTYYRCINEEVKQRLGGLHSAKCILASVDFQEIESCQSSGDWNRSADILGNAAAGLERAGAELVLICTNTMHKVAPQVQACIGVPLLHIAEATADVLEDSGIRKVGLLGTRYTMLQDFYKEHLAARGLEVIIPSPTGVELVDRVIFKELCMGICAETSRQAFLTIIDDLADQGAQGVILGCTEIGLLIDQHDTKIPLFDTTLIHARRAVELALK